MRHGKKPKMRNRIIPGIRKSENGECSKMDKGNPPSNLPDGEIIKNDPPPIALTPRNNNNAIRMFLAVVGFISIVILFYNITLFVLPIVVLLCINFYLPYCSYFSKQLFQLFVLPAQVLQTKGYVLNC